MKRCLRWSFFLLLVLYVKKSWSFFAVSKSRATKNRWCETRTRKTLTSNCYQRESQHPRSRLLQLQQRELESSNFLHGFKNQFVLRCVSPLFERRRCLKKISGTVLWLFFLFAFPSTAPAKCISKTPITATASSAMAVAVLNDPLPLGTQLRLAARLVSATLLGGVVGKERSTGDRAHPAGVRTMSLVALGAALWTICSAYGFVSGSNTKCDPSRMASNVASGVGFIGAGVITTNSKNQESMVHGLTTAAAIWLSAAVGVGCGVGLHGLAAVATALTIAVLRVGKAQPIVIIRRRRRPQNERNKTTVTRHRTTTTVATTRVQMDPENHGQDNQELLFRSSWKDTAAAEGLHSDRQTSRRKLSDGADDNDFTLQKDEQQEMFEDEPDEDEEVMLYHPRHHMSSTHQGWNVTDSGNTMRRRVDDGKKEP